MSQLQMFGLNIWLLIGILTLMLIGGVIFLVGYTSVRAWLTTRAQDRSFAQFRANRNDAQGRPKPQQGSGICRRCSDAVSDGYYTPEGCLCVECYDTQYSSIATG